MFRLLFLFLLLLPSLPLLAESQKKWSILGGIGYGFDFSNKYRAPVKGNTELDFGTWKGKSYSYAFYAERFFSENGKKVGLLFGTSSHYYDYRKKDRSIAQELGITSASFIDFGFSYHFLEDLPYFKPHFSALVGLGHTSYPERLASHNSLGLGGRSYIGESGFIFTEFWLDIVESKQDGRARDNIRSYTFRLGYGMDI